VEVNDYITLMFFIFMTQVDPFLHLIKDNKLQAVSFAPENLTINYGSKEDDKRALHKISKLLNSENQRQEIFVLEIVKSLENMSEAKLLLYKCQIVNLFWTV